MTIDVWMQHPTQRFLRSDMLSSLRRWTGKTIPDDEIPIEATVASMDAAGVDFGLLTAWRGPHGQDLVSNAEVAEWISAYPDRLAGLATAYLDQFGTNYPMIAHTHALAGLDGLGLSEDGRHDFLHGNAQRVFRLDTQEAGR